MTCLSVIGVQDKVEVHRASTEFASKVSIVAHLRMRCMCGVVHEKGLCAIPLIAQVVQ
jgi:hypothetical protein